MSMYDDDDDRHDGAHLGFPDTWIEWFCRRRGYEWLCEVELSFIGASTSPRGGGACARSASAAPSCTLRLPPLHPRVAEDSFNMYGLKTAVNHYREALEIIVGPPPDSGAYCPLPSLWEGLRTYAARRRSGHCSRRGPALMRAPHAPADNEGIACAMYGEAKDLFYLIHARFIVSSKGLQLMVRRCWRLCSHQTRLFHPYPTPPFHLAANQVRAGHVWDLPAPLLPRCADRTCGPQQRPARGRLGALILPALRGAVCAS